ncbi:MoxR family ATPase [Halogeometricum sp. S1BR25-6]|uniref:MoxR family ATPase n=1 Tax=Halogeometricum salsisoli TaxID=2950536 RepID=A0ABU2GAM2_9EURY|nr:MoxR family ATPase [Halogeometricum sp. S1BR25-6]MDS0297794.1 MoxR family ATPase [Halogeometricum sp. S1BR25-6]
MTDRPTTAFADVTEAEIRAAFEAEDYVAEDDIVTTVLLALRLGKPLLVEGEPGAGKTELAKVLAARFGSELVRLQCYEGLTAEHALYEWNYAKQLLAVQSGGAGPGGGGNAATDADLGPGPDADPRDPSVFTEEYLLERPLLRALRSDADRPPVLLVDEIDRADDEFEALLLEVLSDFQVSVPELGTVRAARPPVVVVTSNRTRALSDALKRRCLYLHVAPPSFEKETTILERKVPELDGLVASELAAMAARLREEPLRKPPGAAETIDWARAVAALRDGGGGGDAGGVGADIADSAAEDGADEELSPETVRNTLGCLLKEVEDVERVDDRLLEELLAAAERARSEA